MLGSSHRIDGAFAYLAKHGVIREQQCSPSTPAVRCARIDPAPCVSRLPQSGERSGATGSGVRGAGRAAESGAGPGGRSGEGEPEPARSHAPS